MDTATYISPDEILSSVLPMVGDKDMKVFPEGFYLGLVQQAVEALALHTFFQELHHDYFDFDWNTLSAPLPDGCFNTKGAYIFNGNHCNYDESIKLWWKRNYYTKGNGYIANDKGRNDQDPFMTHRGIYNSRSAVDKQLIRWDNGPGGSDVNQKYFYNIQMGKIMVSSYCRGKRQNVHLVYNGTGCKIGSIPIIPIYLRAAVQDFVAEATLRMRMAEDGPKAWVSLWQIYDKRLNDNYDGSMEKARLIVQKLNSGQKSDLKEYLSRGSWSNGL